MQQGAAVHEIRGSDDDDLTRALATNGVAVESAFDAEILVRHPATFADLKQREDRRDERALIWNGECGTGEVPAGAMPTDLMSTPTPGPVDQGTLRHTPMFFRENEMNVDLAGIHGHAGNRTVFLILNGPSFTEADREALRDRPGVVTFGVNNGAHAFRPDLWTCVDDPSRFMRSIWEDGRIWKFVPMDHFQKPIVRVDEGSDPPKERVRDFPLVFGYRRNHEFRAQQWLWEDTINWGNHQNRGGGSSVMLVALRLAWLLGFRRVYLLGCDFQMAEGDGGYWFPEHRTRKAVSNNTNSYRLLTAYFTALAPEFARVGYEIYNCNPRSGLRVFPHRPLAEALAEATVDTSASTVGMYVSG